MVRVVAGQSGVEALPHAVLLLRPMRAQARRARGPCKGDAFYATSGRGRLRELEGQLTQACDNLVLIRGVRKVG
eukprot:15461640-Alexandrium_andersonii.AAC.1